MDATGIAALISALGTGLIPAIGAMLAKTRRGVDEHVRTVEDELRDQRALIETALRHIGELRNGMSLAGIEPPPLPPELTRPETR